MTIEQVQGVGQIHFSERIDHLRADAEHLLSREIIKHHRDEFEQRIQPLALGQRVDVGANGAQEFSCFVVEVHGAALPKGGGSQGDWDDARAGAVVAAV